MTTYVEMSSDDDGDSRRGRRTNKSEDDYEDANDCYDPVETETNGDENSVSGSDHSDSNDMASDDERCARRSRIKTVVSRSSRNTKQLKASLPLNPDNLVRVNAMGRLAGETLYHFHRRCLLRYKEIYSDMLVKTSFVVPWAHEWACEMWGMKLGRLVDSIRYEVRYLDEDLAAIGFDYGSQVKDRWEPFKLALQTYNNIHGHLRIPQRFIIPRDSTRWPDNIWDMRLGRTLSKTRNRTGYFAMHRQELRDMGLILQDK